MRNRPPELESRFCAGLWARGYNPVFLASGAPEPLGLLRAVQARIIPLGDVSLLAGCAPPTTTGEALSTPITTQWVAPPASETLLPRVGKSLGGTPGQLPPELRGLAVRLEFTEGVIDRVPPEVVDQYLHTVDLAHCALAVQSVLLGAGERLCIVTEVLRIAAVQISFATTGGRPAEPSFDAIDEATGLHAMHVRRGVMLLEAVRPGIVGFRCYRVVERHLRLALETVPTLNLSWRYEPVLLSDGRLAEIGTAGDVESAATPFELAEDAEHEYIMMPDRGFSVDPADERAAALFRDLHERPPDSRISVLLGDRVEAPLIKLDSMSVYGPKLVRLRREHASLLEAVSPRVRLEPVVAYSAAAQRRPRPTPLSGGCCTVEVLCSRTGRPLEGAEVIAITNLANGAGSRARSDQSGIAELDFGNVPAEVDALWVVPPAGYWGVYAASARIHPGHTVTLEPLQVSPIADALAHYYGSADPSAGAGVRVALIGAGVGPHSDLKPCSGCNVVTGERPEAHEDNGCGYDTHAAGIFAARLAPAATLYSFRTFAAGSETTTNYALLRAILCACEAGCDVIHLAVQEAAGENDRALEIAFEEIRLRGAIVVVPAGDDGRRGPGVLARYASRAGFIAAALGRRGAYPCNSVEASEGTSQPAGADPAAFVAAFSSCGGVSFLAPGVGIVSTAVGGGYTPRSSTSVASAVVAAAAARVISRSLAALPAARDAVRARALMSLVASTALPLGFPVEYEGSGLPAG